jgi:hypothetical protein
MTSNNDLDEALGSYLARRPLATMAAIGIAVLCHTLMMALDKWQVLPEYSGILGWVMSAAAGATVLKRYSGRTAAVNHVAIFVALLALLFAYSFLISWYWFGERL